MRRKSVFWLALIVALVLNTFHLIAFAQEPGADTIGDPFYALLGNGGYDVQHYTLDLAVDVAANTIDGTVTIDAQATQDLSSFNLDFLGFTISAITVNGAAATWDHQSHELIITPADPLLKDTAFTVSVAYSGTPTGVNVAAASSMPSLSGWVNFGDGIFVASEPAGAAGWYPVNDHPLDKATYTLRITVPKPYVVAANGLLQDTIDDGESSTYVWELIEPAASYLISVNIGEFDILTEDGPHGVVIRNYVPPKYADLAQVTFGRTADMMAYFEELFGPYPFEAYGVAVVNTELGFALENQTMSLFGVDRVGLTGLIDEVVAHELSHQWLGDNVSLATWGDIWLNEGFATYASWLWFEHASTRTSLDRHVTEAYNQIAADTRSYKITFKREQFLGLVQAMSPDVTLPTEDVAQITRLLLSGTATEDEIAEQIAILPPETVTAEQLAAYVTLLPFDIVSLTPAQVDELFTLIALYEQTDEPLTIPASHYVPPGKPTQRDLFNRGVYLRGALTLHALRLMVGDEAFFAILKTYYTRYQGGNVTTADFIGVAEEISGQDLQAFFDDWLYAPVMPDIPDMGLSVALEE